MGMNIAGSYSVKEVTIDCMVDIMVSVAMGFENPRVTGYGRGRGRDSNLNGNSNGVRRKYNQY